MISFFITSDSLGSIHAEAGVKPLLKLLKDQDASVKREAASALGKIANASSLGLKFDSPFYAARALPL
ncbi:MAG: armadillo/beta-catenin-like repeat-containing protein [Leptolyngbyaceae cyanobacterium CAN_BIN12]|nr:armadillo/beta-catenin-like repeat-containing protein [Leptolyngbyaceae cyanobacterium CAN_BIN12]